MALGKDYLFVYLEKIFAECLTSWLSAKNIYLFFLIFLCRVSSGWLSAKLGTTATQCPAMPSASTGQS